MTKTNKFSQTRPDFAYDLTKDFKDKFELIGSLPPKDAELGYDFRNSCKPAVLIKPLHKTFNSLDPQTATNNPNDYEIHILVEDLNLGISEPVPGASPINIPNKNQQIDIDLKAFPNLPFRRGFKVKCLITRKKDLKRWKRMIGAPTIKLKSQIVFETDFPSFGVSNINSSYEILWDTMPNDEITLDIDWHSIEVSNEPDIKCFTIRGNEKLEDKINHLPKEPNGKAIVIALLVPIITRIFTTCLRNCNCENGPAKHSLHESLLDSGIMDEDEFYRLSDLLQNGSPLDICDAENDIANHVQVKYRMASEILPEIRTISDVLLKSQTPTAKQSNGRKPPRSGFSTSVPKHAPPPMPPTGNARNVNKQMQKIPDGEYYQGPKVTH